MSDRNNYITVFETGKKGNITVKGSLKNGVKEGLWQYFDAAGRVVMEEHYKEGKLDGTFRSYYTNGLLLGHGHYADNKRHGKFIIFNEDGSLKETRIYDHGELVRTSLEDSNDDQLNWPG